MLAHKVDGEHPARYSDLFLAAQKLERWAEARDLLLLKATSMGGLNVTCSQTSGNLFPSWKLKRSHNFTARLATVESNGVAEDWYKEEVDSSDGEDPKTSGGVERADQLLGYIIHLANVVELYQNKNQNCFGCGSPPQGPQQDCLKSKFKCKRGMTKKGGWTPQKPVVTQPLFLDEATRAQECPKNFPS